jgi:hypothetical protein
MQRVYLLLRNNQESGPYTIDELGQQHLSANDLVWVEGKSSAWAYPSELDELGSIYLEPAINGKGTQLTGTAAVKGEIENRAEELRKRALSYTPQSFYTHHTHSADQEKYRSVLFPGEEGIDFVYHGRRRVENLSQYVAAAMLAILLGVGWYQRGLLFPIKTDDATTASARIVSTEANLAKVTVENPAPATMATVPSADSEMFISTAAVEPVTRKLKPSNNAYQSSESNMTASTTVEPAVINDAAGIAEEKREEIVSPPPVVPQQAVVIEKTEPVSTDKETAEASEEKKRGLGQALKGLFKKKKKDDEKPSEESKATPVD